MQPYRRKVQDTLTQLEAIVRGMEQFGSKPGSPVEECIQVVQSCRLFVGVFGMRYGSVPDGYEKSMTHLEYDEAQRLQLPSLIYIIDENHPIPAKDVETGPGAERLQLLKEHLKKRHLVSFFTTPDDLGARLMHDIPTQLEQMGVEVTGELAKVEEASDLEVLRQFEILPKLFSSRQLTIEFLMGDAYAAPTENCAALDLEIGATVTSFVTLGDSGQTVHVYGQREIALALLKVPKKSYVRAGATTAFGTRREVQYSEDGAITETSIQKGIVIKEILQVGTKPTP